MILDWRIMKNSLIDKFINKITIKVSGPNLSRFIKRINDHEIDIYQIKNKKEAVYITILKKDYEKVLEIKTIYEIEVVNFYGLFKLKQVLVNNKFVISIVLFSFITVLFFSNLILDIKVITNDSKMEKNILELLKENGITRYRFKKKYKTIEQIKSKIIDKYREDIEWIEIEEIGTNYIIRYEPRIVVDEKEECPNRHIIAKKAATIYDVDAKEGLIKKETNSYVKKGDIIVSGYIDLNDNIKDTVCSKGVVYGEVWYKVDVTYPLKYYEEKETGNSKNVYTLKIINKEIELFNFSKYKNKVMVENVLLYSNVLPIKLVKQKQRETVVIDENNTVDEAYEKGIEVSRRKIESNLKENEFIKDYKVLNKSSNEENVSMTIFFTVVENITEYQLINEYIPDDIDDNDS